MLITQWFFFVEKNKKKQEEEKRKSKLKNTLHYLLRIMGDERGQYSNIIVSSEANQKDYWINIFIRWLRSVGGDKVMRNRLI